MPSVVIINGKRFELPDGAGNIAIKDQSVSVDGVVLNHSSSATPETLRTVEIIGNVGRIRCDRGSVNVKGDVFGDVFAGGSVTTSGRVAGSASAGGSMSIGGSVGGSVRAGGSVSSGNGLHF